LLAPPAPFCVVQGLVRATRDRAKRLAYHRAYNARRPRQRQQAQAQAAA
jgi:hypothetical protein